MTVHVPEDCRLLPLLPHSASRSSCERRREEWSRETSPKAVLPPANPGQAGQHPLLPRALPLRGAVSGTSVLQLPRPRAASGRGPGCSAPATLVTREGWKVLLGLGSGPWNEGLMSKAVAEGRGDMKPEEGGSEPGTSQELLQRLRELEAENSALAQANENQRETYERCLDEVANHVVQALLNQKDLRQECLRLQKRVFDLERQNQTLSDLFQQKVQLTTGSLPQLALHPVSVVCSPPASLQLGSMEKLAPSLPLGRCALPRELGYSSQSMEALSPFFKKKAQILEVLRKLEETDPLLGPPPCPLSPWRDPHHSPAEPGSHKFQPVLADSRSQPESPVNGEGPHELWPSCLLRAQNGLEEVLKWKGEEGGALEAEGGLPQLLPPLCSQQKSEGSSSSSSDETGELGPPGEALLSALPEKKLDLGLLLEETECYLQQFLKQGCPLNGEPAAAYRPEGPPGALDPKPGGLAKALSQDMLTGLSVMGKCQPTKPASDPAQGGADKPAFGTAASSQDLGPFLEPALERQAYISLCLSGAEPPEKSAKGSGQTSAQGKPKLQPGSASPGTGALPLPSPSKMVKFLKMPTPGEKPQGPNPLRLSPQLTRSSRIPCRSNNYEPCPSPVLSRRASPEGPAVPACPLPPGAGGQGSPKAGRHLAPGTAEATVHFPEPHDYENVSELSVGGLASPLERPKGSHSTPSRGARPDALHCPPELCPYAPAKEGRERGAESPPAARRNAGGSAGPRRPRNSAGKKQLEPGHPPFKERLSALGKLKSAEARERKEALGLEKNSCPGKARAPGQLCEEALEARAQLRPGAGGSLKHQEQCHGGEPAGRCYSSGSVGSRLEAETCSSKHYAAKARQPGALCPAGTPIGPRNPPKAPPVPPAKGAKSPHGSPTKLPSKSPIKAPAKAGAPRPPAEEPRPGGPKLPLTPPPSAGRKPPDCAKALPLPGQALPTVGPVLHSAIEEKVMKGIEENVLRRQGQDKGLAGEGKPKNSSGIASWFGLRRSKLPALSRRPEGLQWGGGASPLRREGKVAACKLEAESLNISKLMEKAEDLRKALEAEKAFISGLALEKGRPHTCGILMEQTQNQLQVMYQEVTAEDFMQQLLNRVDGKESYESRLEQKRELRDFQRVSHDAKDPRLFRPPRNGIVGHLRSCEETPEKGPDSKLREEIRSDDSLAESVNSQHFTACGSLTRTLDSGIGTFPPPDYCSGAPSKNLPKLKPSLDLLPSLAPGQPPGGTRVPRKARTLEREVPSTEDVLAPGKHQSMPAFHGVLASAEPPPSLHGHRVCPEDPRLEPGRARRVQQSKNWTFPNSKACGDSVNPFLCTAQDLEGLHGLAGSSAYSTAERKRASSDGPRLPPPSPQAFSTSRTPSASDVGEEGSMELKSRDTGQGQPGLENSESPSDSLYDSLSSCGSQG
ncbi:nck-associated protein 5-like isoform X2 [Gopherus evgoodei]|uniref:nck-associated protein 5-like isoform X2 n=1 Tax=Gopherus evgoodei TaxID=1825980 RepID=UPI0011CF08DA|nr:nck-associated protein 5-like isoform X2 [Gopherus evgoodei]